MAFVAIDANTPLQLKGGLGITEGAKTANMMSPAQPIPYFIN